MTAGKFDLVVEKGTDCSVPFRVLDSEKKARNFNGWKARMQIREWPSSASFIDELTTENERIRIVGEGAAQLKEWVILHWPNDVSASISSGTFVYDIELVSPSGKVERVLEGKIRFVEEVTR